MIEQTEAEIARLKACLADPKCYQQMGISALSDELAQKESELEPLIERFLQIEEKLEALK